jgi:hypothetical protein
VDGLSTDTARQGRLPPFGTVERFPSLKKYCVRMMRCGSGFAARLVQDNYRQVGPKRSEEEIGGQGSSVS